MNWLKSTQLADLAGTGRQRAHEVLCLTSRQQDYRWRGFRLVVEQAHGRGGRAGISYVVRVDSLPPDLQDRFKTLQRPVQLALRFDDPATAEREWKHAVVAPAIAHPPRSAERRAAVRAIIAAEHIRGGRRVRVPERTVLRWLADFDAHGLAGLNRKKRAGAGEAAVLLTRRWDRATASLPDAERAAIAERTKRDIRSLWAGGASYAGVHRLASEELAMRTREAGLDLAPTEMEAACDLPKHVIEAGRPSRRVHERRTNIKKWDDERPRVRLTSGHLAPMEIVYGDVHHFDVYLKRTDDTLATPKGIAWLDAANRRLRIDLVLCEPGTGIRNADLIQSFIDMTRDPRWGVPRQLYLDNGSEYRFAEFLDDPLKLAGLGCQVSDRSSSIFRAKPYNASAKGILEGTFRILEQKVLAPLTGYIGGDRMKTRTGNLGKAPVPYDGTFEQFAERYRGLETYFNTDPQKGELKGLSPNVAFGRAVDAGWKRTDIDPDALRTAFSIEETRQVTKGSITVGGERLYGDELFRHNGETVRIQRPKFLKWDGVPVFTLKGRFIGVAKFDGEYGRDDPEGAKEAARRRQVADLTITDMQAEVDVVDVPSRMVASGKRKAAPPVPESVGAIVLNDTAVEVGRQLRETPGEKRDREHARKQKAQRERLKLLQQYGMAK